MAFPQAAEMHTLLYLHGSMPAFIHISDGKKGNIKVHDNLPFDAGAFYFMDRVYLDFARLNQMHQAGAFFLPASSAAWIPSTST